MYSRKSLLLLLILVLVMPLSKGAFAQEVSETPTPRPPTAPTHTPSDVHFLAVIRELMLEHEDCQLPCFWGLQPGRTTLEEVQTFSRDYLSRGLINGHVTSPEGITYRSIVLDLLPSGSDYAIVMALTFEDDVLSVLEVNLHGLQEWLPENRFGPSVFLAELPALPDVYLGVNVSTALIAMLVVDNGNGVMAKYTFPLKTEGNRISPNLNNSLLLCPKGEDTESLTLWLQDKDEEAPMQELISNPTLPTSSVNFYQPVEWITGLSNQSIVERIVDNPDDCIEMLSYRELRERGYEF